MKPAGISNASAGIGAVETETSSVLMVIRVTVPEGPVAGGGVLAA